MVKQITTFLYHHPSSKHPAQYNNQHCTTLSNHLVKKLCWHWHSYDYRFMQMQNNNLKNLNDVYFASINANYIIFIFPKICDLWWIHPIHEYSPSPRIFLNQYHYRRHKKPTQASQAASLCWLDRSNSNNTESKHSSG